MRFGGSGFPKISRRSPHFRNRIRMRHLDRASRTIAERCHPRRPPRPTSPELSHRPTAGDDPPKMCHSNLRSTIPAKDVSFRPEQDSFIVLRSGETPAFCQHSHSPQMRPGIGCPTFAKLRWVSRIADHSEDRPPPQSGIPGLPVRKDLSVRPEWRNPLFYRNVRIAMVKKQSE